MQKSTLLFCLILLSLSSLFVPMQGQHFSRRLVEPAFIMEKPQTDPFYFHTYLKAGTEVKILSVANEKYFYVNYLDTLGFVRREKFNLDAKTESQIPVSEVEVSNHETTRNQSASQPARVTSGRTSSGRSAYSPKRSQAVRCSGMTQKNGRCHRRTTNASGRCWQHE